MSRARTNPRIYSYIATFPDFFPDAEDDIKLQIGIQMLREAAEMRVTSAVGTDLTVNLRGAPCGGTAGFGTRPGAVAHWPAGLCLAFPGKDAVRRRCCLRRGWGGGGRCWRGRSHRVEWPRRGGF